jgi:phage regulator Rha-like protein
MKNKKQISEASIAGFINRFLGDMQKGTQDRFIQRAKQRKLPKDLVNQMEKIEKERQHLDNIIKKYSK